MRSPTRGWSSMPAKRERRAQLTCGAEFVALASTDPAIRGQVIEVGGPENLTMTAFVDLFRKETRLGNRRQDYRRWLST